MKWAVAIGVAVLAFLMFSACGDDETVVIYPPEIASPTIDDPTGLVSVTPTVTPTPEQPHKHHKPHHPK